MLVNSLSSKQSITKCYTKLQTGEVTKTPYPFIYEVTSHAHMINGISDLKIAIEYVAQKQRCLVKGKLGRELQEESRAGATDPDQATEWICLDLDGVENVQTVDVFLQAIGLGNVDYVLQWSSSMGIENQTGFRCHIFMLLKDPAHPALLKHWLTYLNISTPILNSQLQLTKTGNSLRWPLDITTCQNDKLIYVAPPILNNIPDPFPGNRISLHLRQERAVTLPSNIPSKVALREMVEDKVNELREKASLPKRKKFKFKFEGDIEYFENPDQAEITGMKQERGFVYFNLNGGDSWAYYHPENNPMYIFNFKGEPVYRTQDLLPGYWAKIAQRVKNYDADPTGLVYLAFRDITSASYFNGTYNTKTDELKLFRAGSKDQLKDFMKQHGQPFGDFIPDWDLVFDPLDPRVIDFDHRTINTYQPSEHFKRLPGNGYTSPPATVDKIVSHVLGGDADTIEHFYNWLACIAQHRERNGTAWVLQGTQGTGKGLLFHHILAPIFGLPNVVSKRMDEIESSFTGFMQGKSIVFIDEIEAGRSLYHNKITAKLKNLIVEPTISVRHMYQEAKEVKNFCNMIFASNKPDPVEVAVDDRRFNVGGYQMKKLQISTQEVETLLPSELFGFYSYLMTRTADRDKARTPHHNEARAILQDISQNSIDVVAKALIDGDLRFFWDNLIHDRKTLSPIQAVNYEPFRTLILDKVQSLDTKFAREDLFTVFQWTVGGMAVSPNKFTSQLKHHRIALKHIRYQGTVRRGIDINQWTYDPQWHAQALQDIAAGLV